MAWSHSACLQQFPKGHFSGYTLERAPSRAAQSHLQDCKAVAFMQKQ
jgi:hypothetical protein